MKNTLILKIDISPGKQVFGTQVLTMPWVRL